MKKNYISLITLFILASCSSVSEDDLLEPIILEPGETVNYTEDIKPIMENNCTFCHSSPPVNGAPNALVTYNDVVNAVNNSNLIDRISRASGEAGAMPLGGPKLPQNLIDLVIQWQLDGLLEN
ncbi:hypothetical protein [Lacinutrix jangbogonensis]|uniref:hypothetical protein n=1 Tax=Lacinutrix jangbogonensis TaxID=1469557 RepID=UPI00053DF4BA|nr:hypothetical protein [Lacinutrix jangbogonensis]